MVIAYLINWRHPENERMRPANSTMDLIGISNTLMERLITEFNEVLPAE